MDKILIMVDLKDDKNIITVTEGDIVDTQLYNREEIIEQFSEIIDFLMFDLEEDKNA